MTFVLGTNSLSVGTNFCSIVYIVGAFWDFLLDTYTTFFMDKRIILFDINHGWMDGYVCGIPVCSLYFILSRAFVILNQFHMNKYMCTL